MCKKTQINVFFFGYSLSLHYLCNTMKTIFFPDQALNDGAYAATIGFFDGVHQGHQFLIRQLKEEAARKGLRTMAVTFERHPRQVVQGEWKPELLTPLHKKLKLLKSTGIDTVVVLRFNRQMAGLTAFEFMKEVLSKALHVKLLLTGYDNRFGHDRTEGFEDYLRYGKMLNIDVLAGQPLNINGQAVCSSLIRQLLHDGRITEANNFLGRPYTIQGTVVHGEQIGRHLGFPTANLQADEQLQLIPKNGVYAVRCWDAHPGIMNIGMRPTFDGQKKTLEIHLFNFNDDIYGEALSVTFVERLRDEQHFANAEALRQQMEKDANIAKLLLNPTIQS